MRSFWIREGIKSNDRGPYKIGRRKKTERRPCEWSQGAEGCSRLTGNQTWAAVVSVPNPNCYSMRASGRSLGPGFHQFKREFDKELEGRGESKCLLEKQDVCA